jgi:hypothetical protein
LQKSNTCIYPGGEFSLPTSTVHAAYLSPSSSQNVRQLIQPPTQAMSGKQFSLPTIHSERVTRGTLINSCVYPGAELSLPSSTLPGPSSFSPSSHQNVRQTIQSSTCLSERASRSTLSNNCIYPGHEISLPGSTVRGPFFSTSSCHNARQIIQPSSYLSEKATRDTMSNNCIYPSGGAFSLPCSMVRGPFFSTSSCQNVRQIIQPSSYLSEKATRDTMSNNCIYPSGAFSLPCSMVRGPFFSTSSSQNVRQAMRPSTRLSQRATRGTSGNLSTTVFLPSRSVPGKILSFNCSNFTTNRIAR